MWERIERNTREKREGVYCKLLCVCKLLVLVIKQCVLSPPSVSKPPPVVSPTNTLFSLVFVSILSTQNNISLACYLYTNSKQDISTFKCEGGWRLVAGSCGWSMGGCLPWPSGLSLSFNRLDLWMLAHVVAQIKTVGAGMFLGVFFFVFWES